MALVPSSTGRTVIRACVTHQASSKWAARRMNERLDAVALASLSPRRRDLLEGLGLQVTVIRSAFDEKAATWDGDPPELAAEFACRKAAAAENAGPSLVIAADTIVVIDGQLLGKPADPNQAAR